MASYPNLDAAVAQQLVRLYASCRGGDVAEALQYVNVDKVKQRAPLYLSV